MKLSLFSRRSCWRFLFPAILLICLVGCSTTPKINWAERVGIYTFDQAVVELGPPDKSAKLADDSIVAEWLTQRGATQGFIGTGAYYGGAYPYRSYGPVVQPYYQSTSPNYYIRLVFGPDGKLTAWKKVAK